MAITAINAVVADVVFMTELNGLLALDVLAGVPARASDLCGHPKRRREHKDSAENRRARQVVRTMTENLWHRRRNNFVRLADVLVQRVSNRRGPRRLTLLPKTRLSYCWCDYFSGMMRFFQTIND